MNRHTLSPLGAPPISAEGRDTQPAYYGWADLLMAASDPDWFAEMLASRDAALADPGRAERIAQERRRLMAELRPQESPEA